ncbi:hypothetical protein AAG570_006076 [Ranatra chinensis]|uniref:Sodium/potassium-transporting ATPase subunit beta-1-interacting protein n=1 Tax=Ranatra chinensis TaxID=642074 RepID=A0ABD0XWZ4_9HEMI
MWGPILVNFFQIIFVIFGFFGAWQFRSKYMLCYAIWSIFWCGWNVFVICFYENVGILNRESDVLNLGAGSFSWWEANGPGCKALFLANGTGGDSSIETYPWRPPRPDVVTGCLVPYHHLESAQAAVHLILAVSIISTLTLDWKD